MSRSVVAEDLRGGAGTEQTERLRSAFDAHYVALVRLATALTGRRDMAEEIVQEAFVRALPKLPVLEDEAIHPYLRRVVVNLWKNRVRRLMLERRYERQGRIVQDPAASIVERDSLWRAVLALPARQRACIVLRFYEDLPEREVADVLGCAVGTVKSHTSRGLARLKSEVTA
jgi:RNA polymerase sigma-70 factor (sigma-E family)